MPQQLKEGKSPWTTATGLVVRGYVSKIDESAQPYGLEIPKDFDFDLQTSGIGSTFGCMAGGKQLTELSFINQRSKSPGAFHPPGAIVLHPYGRYCNANHFAGEVDLVGMLGRMSRSTIRRV